MQFRSVLAIALFLCGNAPRHERDNRPVGFEEFPFSLFCVDYFSNDSSHPKKYRFYHKYVDWHNPIYKWMGPSGEVMTFEGVWTEGGFWHGKLNGKDAVGFDRNRYHHRLESTDGTIQFECWIKGFRHGRY